MTISKNDWKLYQERLGEWQERHMSDLISKYQEMLSDFEKYPSERFWNLEKEIRLDKTDIGVRCELVKSEALLQIYRFLRNGVITWKDLQGFSDKLVDHMIDWMLDDDDRRLNPFQIWEPYIPEEGDEMYSGGFFTFDVTAMIKDIETGKISPERQIADIRHVDSYVWGHENLKPEHIEKADLSRPLILLEIAPDALPYYPGMKEQDYITRGFVLADGNHRIAKAKQNGITELPMYLIPMETHINYLCGHYKEYAEYWNGKLKDRISDSIYRM